jgi:endoglucanase
MRNHLLVRCLLAVAAFSLPALPAASAPLAETPPERNRMVHQRGTEIVDGNNRPLYLRGVNLGGWLMWEPYLWGAPVSLSVSESEMKDRMKELVGEAEAQRFVEDYQSSFVREADLARIAALGFNLVRVPIHRVILEDEGRPFAYKASGWRLLDDVVDWAGRHGVYVVFDLHAAPGGQSRIYTSDPDRNRRERLWDSRESQDRTVAFWRAVAQRYRDREAVAGYDLLNEPALSRKGELVDLYRRIIAAIREVDPHHMVILEAARFEEFTMFDRPLSSNQVYSFHMYTWFGDNRDKVLKKHAEVARRHQVPLWCGEFGETGPDMVRTTVEMFDSGRYPIYGWAFWPWKKVPKKDNHLLGIAPGAGWDDAVEAIAGRRKLLPRRRPSKEQTLRAMADFLRAIRLEGNVENGKMRDALTRGLRGTPRRSGGQDLLEHLPVHVPGSGEPQQPVERGGDVGQAGR